MPHNFWNSKANSELLLAVCFILIPLSIGIIYKICGMTFPPDHHLFASTSSYFPYLLSAFLSFLSHPLSRGGQVYLGLESVDAYLLHPSLSFLFRRVKRTCLSLSPGRLPRGSALCHLSLSYQGYSFTSPLGAYGKA